MQNLLIWAAIAMNTVAIVSLNLAINRLGKR